MKKIFSMVLVLAATTMMNFAASLEVNCGTQVQISATAAAGYHFVHWNDNNTQNPRSVTASDVTYTAYFAPNTDTHYSVKHWLQNIENNNYPTTPEATDDMTGTTGTATAAIAKSYPGFTAQTITQGTIAGDGNTVVNVYYTRNSYTLAWSTDGNALTGDYTKGSVKYGASITAPNTPTKTGYVFKVWTPTPSSTMPAANTTYTATWDPATDTKYTVKHYQQNLDNNNYTEVVEDRQELEGTTGATTAAAAKTYTGFTAKTFSQTTIAADGSAVVEIYYDRILCTVIWETSGNTLTGDYTNGSVKYGTTLVAPNTPTKSGSGVVYTFSGWNNGSETLTVEQLPVTVTGNVTYTAVFSSTNVYTLTVQSNDDTMGTVNNVSGNYNEGTQVTVTATPADDCHRFVSWSDGGAQSHKVTVDGNKTVTATFEQITYTITVTSADESQGSVSISVP